MTSLIAWPQDHPSARLVGNKAGSLAKLYLAGLPVPQFFCVTTKAYQQFAQLPEVRRVIERLGTHLGSLDLTDLIEAATDIRQAMLAVSLPSLIADSINAAIDQLTDQRVALAIRSSGTVEDVSERSFAGLYHTFLNVRTKSDVLDRVKECWASLWTAESVYTRHQLGIEPDEASMGVLIQALIDADVSGVTFTEGPLPSQSGCLVVNAAWGLGEGIVAGSIPADTYTLRRDNVSLVKRVVADKKQAIVADSTSGTKTIVKTPAESEQPALTDSQLVQLANVALEIEKLFESPQDIEWCYSDDQLYILQSRPITRLGAAYTDEIVQGIKRAVRGRDRKAYWWISNNLGRVPLAPFAQSVWSSAAPACERASEKLAKPTLSTWGIFNDYIYVGERPVREDQETPEQRAERQHALCDEFADKWESESQAEVQMNNDYLNHLNLETASLAELLTCFKRATEIWQRHWEIHDIAMNSKSYVVDKFASMFRQLFGPDEWGAALRLLQGFENINLKINQAIWELAQQAKGDQAVLRCLKMESADDYLRCLKSSPRAADFLDSLNDFLQLWGNRIVGPNDLMHPSWREDPSFLFKTVSSYVETGQVDPAVEVHQLAQERKREERRLLAHLTDQADIREEFVRQLRRAQTWPVFLEDHNYLVEQTLIANIRRIALELGRRFQAAGSIADASDIFFLTVAQVEAAARLPELPDLQALTRKNRETYERKKSVLIPQTLGTPPAETAVSDEAGSEVEGEDFLSMQFYPEPTRDLPARLVGIPGAPGYARGPARVINDINEFSLVKTGDILVCQRTTPPWTPLFSMIAGLVTNAGSGVLQHSAINAREFGIPAVIGTRVATEVIQSEQTIVVDGTRGVVELML